MGETHGAGAGEPQTEPKAKKGRGPLILVTVVLAVLGLIIAGGIGGARYLDKSKRVSDDQNRVSISVPRSWTGTIEEEPAEDGFTPAVLELSDSSTATPSACTLSAPP